MALSLSSETPREEEVEEGVGEEGLGARAADSSTSSSLHKYITQVHGF